MRPIFLLIFALLSGCSNVQFKEAFQEIKQEYQSNPEQQIALSCSRIIDNTYGWKTSSAPCTPGAESNGRSFYIANLEYSEDGSRVSDKQFEAITAWLQKTPGPKVVVSYVHGWHHNAESTSGNYIAFPILTAKIADTSQRLHFGKKEEPVPKVLGIYIGWPGKSSDSLLSIYSRSRVADRVARAGNLTSDLRKIQAVNAQSAQGSLGGSMLVIGHSLGGRLLHQAFLPELEKGQPRPLGKRTLIVTAEAAITADFFHNLMQIDVAPTKFPYWLNVGSKDDKAAALPTGLAAALGFLPTKNYFASGSFTSIQNYQTYRANYFGENLHTDCMSESRDIALCQSLLQTKKRDSTYPSGVLYALKTKNTKNSDIFFNHQILSTSGEKAEIQANFSNGDFYKLKIESGNSAPLGGRFWNTATDKSIIYSTDENRPNPDHNGYLSTILSRLLVENLWLLNKED